MIDVVGAVIIRDGEILLVREEWDPGVWILPGGKVEEGETTEQCLVRELKEELPNLRPSNIRTLSPSQTFLGQTTAGWIKLTVCLVDADGEFEPGSEITEVRLTDKPEEFDLTWPTRLVITVLRQKGYL